MNFFFGIKEKDIYSKISIPKFQNTGIFNKEIELFSAKIKNCKWEIELEKCEETDYFFNISQNLINNEKIFFIASKKEVDSYFSKNQGMYLEDISKFTNTAPSFRCNLKVFNKNFGYSSYQSDYPFKMINKNGNITSSLYLLTNKNADKNYLFFRNIFYKPIHDKFELYIVDINQKKVLFKKEIISNYSNLIEIQKEYINENSYIFTKKYLGIPIYISLLDGHISFEHTHPPHTYILSKKKYELVGKIKANINEIIG